MFNRKLKKEIEVLKELMKKVANNQQETAEVLISHKKEMKDIAHTLDLHNQSFKLWGDAQSAQEERISILESTTVRAN